MIRQECIEFQASKQYEKWHNPNGEHNWRMAEESLKIFPSWVRQIPNGYKNNGNWGYGDAVGIMHADNPMVESQEGCFLIEYKPVGRNWSVQWVPCREYVEIVFLCQNAYETTSRLKEGERNKEGFYFFSKGKGRDLCEFIREFENRLGLIELSLFSTTNFNNIVWIQPSQFWFQESIRFSLFPLLVRKGTYYNRSFDQTISECFGGTVKDAILRFLGGHRHFTGVHTPATRRGWIYLFAHGNVNDLLV